MLSLTVGESERPDGRARRLRRIGVKRIASKKVSIRYDDDNPHTLNTRVSRQTVPHPCIELIRACSTRSYLPPSPAYHAAQFPVSRQNSLRELREAMDWERKLLRMPVQKYCKWVERRGHGTPSRPSDWYLSEFVDLGMRTQSQLLRMSADYCV